MNVYKGDDDTLSTRTMDTKTQYAWIATIATKFAPASYEVTRWYDSKRECIKEQQLCSACYDIPDCWGSYQYYIVTKTPIGARACLPSLLRKIYKGPRLIISDASEQHEYTFDRIV
jgi:hypothetical protein